MNPFAFFNNWGSGNSQYYDALKDKGRRRPVPTGKIRSADNKLTDVGRRQMSAKASQAQDNFSLAAWMVRTYLNHVASVNFKPTTKNVEVDKALEDWYKEWSLKENCDAAGKHPMRRIIRLWEGRRLMDGDAFMLKIGGKGELRGTVQLIEADRIASPDAQAGINQTDQPPNLELFTNGVRLTKAGRAMQYMVNTREADGTLEFERTIAAANMIHHGFFDRVDQIRGISPFTSALNTMGDLYESFDYTMGKIKLASIFSAAIVRDADMGIPGVNDDNAGSGADPDWSLDLDDGAKVFDISTGEDVKIIESNSVVGTGTLDYMKIMVQLTMKALDLPMSFYSEDFTNFYGSRGAVIQFKKATKPKQADLIDSLNDMMKWRIGMAIADGDLKLPKGFKYEDLSWDWITEGMEMWDPVKEVAGYKSAIAAGLDSPQRICRMIGTDYDQNLADIEEARDKAEAHGIQLDFAISSSSSKILEESQQSEPAPDTSETSEDDEDTDAADTPTPDTKDNENAE